MLRFFHVWLMVMSPRAPVFLLSAAPSVLVITEARCTVTIHYKIIPDPDTLYLYSSDPPLHTLRIPSTKHPHCSRLQQHDQMVPQPTLSGSQVCRIYPRCVGQVTGAVLSIILTSGTCWVIPPSTQHQHKGEEWTMWLVSSVRRHCVV